MAVYVEFLVGYPREQLEKGFQRTIAEWDRGAIMPPIAFIAARVRSTTLRGEQRWELVKRVFDRHWHPDIGLHSNPPALDAASQYALRQIGGWRGLAESSLEHEGFIRDRFLDAFNRFHAEGGEQERFTQELAEQTLKRLYGARAKQITGSAEN